MSIADARGESPTIFLTKGKGKAMERLLAFALALASFGFVASTAEVFEQQEQWILALRRRCLGARPIRSELLREHDCKRSLATIHKEMWIIC